MSFTILKEYLKVTFFSRRSPQWFTFIILFFFVILLEVIGLMYNSLFLFKIACHALALTIVYMIFQIIMMHYKLFKVFESEHSHQVQRIPAGASPELALYLKEMHERLERLEQYRSPYVPLILIYLICIGIAILMPLIFRSIPQPSFDCIVRML